VFSVSSEYSSIILFASDEGFVYLTEDGGDFVYMDLAAALKKEWAEKTFSVWLALFLIFLLAAAYTLLCCKRSLRQSINGGLKKVGKIAVKHRIAYLSLIPTFLLLAVFYWYPIASSLVLSFFDYLPKEKMIFVGMDNILKVARNTEFWLSFKNTLIFLVADLIKAILPPILFAECLLALRSQKISYWVRVFMFLPGVIPGVAGMLVWADGIYGSTSSGLLNGFLSAISPSFVSRAWLMDKSTALTCLIFIGFPWVGSYLIFFGAISGLPKEMFEAAKLDGCGWWRKLVSFDIPLIVPQIKYIFITTFIGSVQNYTLIYVTTGGDYGTNTPALMMYYAITDQKNYGIASAMGLFLFIFLVGATAVNFKMQFGRTKEDY
jgi:raffinose/stachyose/melibiose transport system permease protein